MKVNIDYDYNLYQALYSDYEDDCFDPTYGDIERFYSDSFDEGFDSYVQKMFAFTDSEKKWIQEMIEEGSSKEEAVSTVVRNRRERGVHNIRVTDPVTKKVTTELGFLPKKVDTGVDKLQKRQQLKEEAEKAINAIKEESKAKQEGLEKSLKRWKAGAIGAGVAAAGGLGAYLYNRKKDR